MIVSHDADWVECGGDLRGHFDIGAGRCRIAAWMMMMHHDQSGGSEFQGALAIKRSPDVLAYPLQGHAAATEAPLDESGGKMVVFLGSISVCC